MGILPHDGWKTIQTTFSSFKNYWWKNISLISQKKNEGKEITIPKSEELVLKHCTGSNSIEDIMEKTKENRNTITMRIKRLKKKGVIKSIKKNGKIIHEQTIWINVLMNSVAEIWTKMTMLLVRFNDQILADLVKFNVNNYSKSENQ